MEYSRSGRIKKKAAEIGFSSIGIARAEIIHDEEKHMREWLDRGFQASMQWMERDAGKRSDVATVLPQAKSVICVALNYYAPVPHTHSPAVGKISRYAWGDDYHEVMRDRLELLSEFLMSEIPGAATKYYVDTGPVMDKAWAVRAGIGWLGKHSNVITRKFGSWVFLGEILIDVELEYDNPALDLCGSCTACLDACPTQAIVQPYVVDSNKCISYLTIEHRGDLPKERVTKFENWIYGCDICQDVCPWNRFQKETDEPAFHPREENRAPELTELAGMSQEEFSRRFKNSPIKRTKHSGLTRNAKAIIESFPDKTHLMKKK
ncbi:MAG: tRNA epoxyqueuosine(34) reductase QueG [Ignavibacteriae bacterium]|nr:MAG: tRNA epoxyqueuosine(34) reductase QueG [Ignavibacteriota bacterium]